MKKTREDQEIRDLDELFERYRQAPESFVFVPLADACRKMGRIDEALEICEGGIQRHPEYPSGHVVKGKCLFDKGDRDGARDVFERVLMLDENNLVALKYLGTIEADSGDLTAAERRFRHILSLDPENKEIKGILATVGEQEASLVEPEPQTVDVMEGVDEILRGNADDADALLDDDAAPDVLVAETPEARDVSSTASGEEIETSDELASVTLAEIFASQGYKSKAEKIYREVLRRQPAADEVRKRLRELTPEEPDVPAGEMEGGPGPTDEGMEARPEIAEDSSEEALAGEVCAVGAVEAGENPPARSDVPEAVGDADSETPEVGTNEASAATRAEISEKDSLSHFRHWLTRMQK